MTNSCIPLEKFFNPATDLNADGRIDNCDSDILAENWGLTGSAIAGASEKTYYYHYDGAGSVTAISDENGDIAEKYRYSVYGDVEIAKANGETRPASIIDNPYYFTGRRLDTETGLYYYRARMYSATIGRFLQTDPIGYADGINWYAYCRNNPIMFVDPFGLCPDRGHSGLEGWIDILGETTEWVLGNAPGQASYGPESRQAKDMRYARSVVKARRKMRTQNTDAATGKFNAGSNIKGLVGEPGKNQWVWSTGFNPTQFFIGGYSINITPDPAQGTQRVEIFNATTWNSAVGNIHNIVLELAGSKKRYFWDADFGPGARYEQVIYWDEPLYSE